VPSRPASSSPLVFEAFRLSEGTVEVDYMAAHDSADLHGTSSSRIESTRLRLVLPLTGAATRIACVPNLHLHPSTLTRPLSLRAQARRCSRPASRSTSTSSALALSPPPGSGWSSRAWLYSLGASYNHLLPSHLYLCTSPTPFHSHLSLLTSISTPLPSHLSRRRCVESSTPELPGNDTTGGDPHFTDYLSCNSVTLTLPLAPHPHPHRTSYCSATLCATSPQPNPPATPKRRHTYTLPSLATRLSVALALTLPSLATRSPSPSPATRSPSPPPPPARRWRAAPTLAAHARLPSTVYGATSTSPRQSASTPPAAPPARVTRRPASWARARATATRRMRTRRSSTPG
jgi:hypothetical protein